MGLKSKVLEALANQQWVTSILAKEFVDKLLAATPPKPVNMPDSLLSANYYGVIDGYEGIECLSPLDSGVQLIERAEPAIEKRLTSIIPSGSALKLASPDDQHKLKEKHVFVEQALLENHPELHAAYREAVSSVAFVDTKEFGAASSPRVFGNLFFGSSHYLRASVTELVQSIAHEMGHQELFLINLLDRLVAQETDGNMQYAPLQDTERPPIGRIHACHALFRILSTHDLKICVEGTEPLVKQLEQTIETLNHGECTAYGQKILDHVYRPFLRKLTRCTD
jgi:hypothetical protein